MNRKTLSLVLALLAAGVGIYLVMQAGKRLDDGKVSAAPTPVVPTSAGTAPAMAVSAPQSQGVLGSVLEGFRANLHEPLSLLLVQLLLIVILARWFGALFVKLGQPAVIGEMVAGIVLGPSVVGALAPGAFQFIFPASSLGALRILSQVGVILFLFVVGMEVELGHLRRRARTAVVVSQVGIVFPFFLGVLLALFLYRSFAPPRADFPAFALFLGTAMSLTAFPVLARIIEDCGMSKTFLGVTAITCAAIGDVSAWSILALVVAIVKAGSPGAFILNILFALVFFSLLALARAPLNRWFNPPSAASSVPSRGVVVSILVMVFGCALFTEVIGLHALFGAFVAGLMMPSDPKFRAHLRERLEQFSSAFLLPLFFAFTGLRTQVGLLNDWSAWGVCLLIIFVATFGKLGGSMLAARWTGMNWHDSFALGALMNTRGLVELIVLNIGYDLGILSPQMFAMMVLMALATTFMTGPLLSLGNFLRKRNPVLANEVPAG